MQADLERYLDHMHERKLVKCTIDRYFKNLIHLFEFVKFKKMKNLNQIKIEDLSKFTEYLYQKGLGKETTKRIKSSCRSFLKFLGFDHLFPKKTPVPYQSPFLPELIDFGNYLLHERGLSENTWNAYQREIKCLLNFMTENQLTSFDQVNYDNFKDFLSTLYAKGLDANSVRRQIAACKTFFRFLAREEIIKANPIKYFETPKTWQKQPDLLTEEEITHLIEKPNIGTKKGLRDRAIFELLYACGLRITELCNLKVIDFRFPEMMVRIARGKGGKERIVSLTKMSVYFLQLYWEKYRPGIDLQSYAFISHRLGLEIPLNRGTVWLIIKKYAKLCGITKNVSPHSFRHAFASHMLENGGELRVIQELLGHAGTGTTGVYLQRSLKQVAQKFHKHHPREEVVENDDSVVIEVI